jgi:predicted helicase
MIISTTYKWSKNAENAIADQLIPTVRIWFNDLEKSPIDWSSFDLYKMDDIRLKPKKITRMHQHEAIIAAINGYKKHDRGKIIMACGTGKTYTSLRLAEKITPQGGLILFLAPSISLVSQTLREWTAESLNPINAFVVCSDSKVGRNNDDIRLHDLAYPPTTNPQKLVKAIKTIILNNQRSRIVIFSTYQSIQSVADAQIYIGEFDLIICDEAHRTTGGTLCNEDSTHFLKIHDNNIIRGKKRLYMTATPRIYAEAAKIKANENDVELFSMDDTKTFGPEFYRLGFSKAVAMGLLSEYKVMIVCVDEARISALATAYKLNSNQAIDIRFAAKIMGCWKSLSKKDTLILSENGIFSNSVDSSFPMQRAVVFSKTIESSRNITATFNHIVEKYLSTNQGNDLIRCTLLHVDGTMNAQVRHQAIDWLRNQPEPNECRVLSNAKCLSEGVDVPALDAVIFF